MALVHCDFFSNVLGMSMSMDVILPSCARPEPFGDSPCLYLLHGLSDDHTIWQRRTSIERYVASMNLAVVMPNAHRSFYTDMAHGLRYWTYLSEEIPAQARALFRLSSRREDNFIAGLSMGGYGAFKSALRCPERFAAAASLSGALDIGRRVEDSEKKGPGSDMALIFGDRPVRGSEDDLFALAERVASRGDRTMPLYQWCGTEDHCYPENVRFREHARRLGLDLTYEEGPGRHEWSYWDVQIRRVLEWLPLRTR